MVDGCENACLALLRWVCGLLFGLRAPALTAGAGRFGLLRVVAPVAAFGWVPPEPGVVGAFPTPFVQAAPTGTVRSVPPFWECLLAPDASATGGTDCFEPLLPGVRSS